MVHDILGTPARMGSTAVLHATQRVLDGLLRGPWPDDVAGDSPVIVVPAAVRIYVEVSPECVYPCLARAFLFVHMCIVIMHACTCKFKDAWVYQ